MSHYRFRPIIPFVYGLLALGLATPSFAQGGFWRVRGTLVNRDRAEFGTIEKTCNVENVQVRFRSRWTGGTATGLNGAVTPFPWGPSWGQSTTDSNGRFSETSYFFANATRSRDILIEARVIENFNDQWRTVTIIRGISGSTPHNVSGNIHTYDLGNLETDLFDCPTEFVPAPRRDLPNIQAVDGKKKNDGKTKKERTVVIRPLPCGWAPHGKPSIDLEFSSVTVRHRDGQPDAPPERITWEVVVKNHGPVEYKAVGACKAKVRMTVFIPELKKEREYSLTLNQSIPAGEEKTFTSNSGNLGEISEGKSSSYNFLFELDNENKIIETNEDNNLESGVYTPSTGDFVQN